MRRTAHLAESAKPARIPVEQVPSSGETESESANGPGPRVGRSCLNAINSKGREGCDGIGGAWMMAHKAWTTSGREGLHSIFEENIYRRLTVRYEVRGRLGGLKVSKNSRCRGRRTNNSFKTSHPTNSLTYSRLVYLNRLLSGHFWGVVCFMCNGEDRYQDSVQTLGPASTGFLSSAVALRSG